MSFLKRIFQGGGAGDNVNILPPDQGMPPRDFRDPFFTQAGIYSLPFPRRELITPRPTPTDPRGLMSQLNALYDRTITPYITPQEEETPPPDDGGGTPPDDGGGTGGGGNTGGGTGGGGSGGGGVDDPGDNEQERIGLPPDIPLPPIRFPPDDRFPPRFPPDDRFPPRLPPDIPPMVPPPIMPPMVPIPGGGGIDYGPGMGGGLLPPDMPIELPPMDMITPPTPPIQVPPRDDMMFAGGSPTFDERGPVFNIDAIRNLIELDNEPEMTESPMMMSGISQLLPTLPDPTISEMDRIMENFDRFSPSRLGMGMGRVR